MQRVFAAVLGAVMLLGAAGGLAVEPEEEKTVEDVYPGLLSGALATARVGDLPEGVVLDVAGVTIRAADVDEVLANAPEELREQLAGNAVFLVQEMATKKLLLRAAQEAAAAAGADLSGKTEPEVIGDFLQGRVADLAVSDAEVVGFYGANPEMFGGAKLADVRKTLSAYLLKGKRQNATDVYVRSLGATYGVVLSASWLGPQALQALDNPVDRARRSGKPSLVDFGSEGCRPCEMLAPILVTLRKKYEGRANVVFVSVGEEPMLAARYGIQSIPVQVFFDAGGKEILRHSGFWPQEELEKQLAEAGAK